MSQSMNAYTLKPQTSPEPGLSPVRRHSHPTLPALLDSSNPIGCAVIVVPVVISLPILDTGVKDNRSLVPFFANPRRQSTTSPASRLDQHTVAKVASGGDSASSGAFVAQLANITSLLKVPTQLQPYLETTAEHLASASEYLQLATGFSPSQVYTAAAGTLLALSVIPVVAARKSKSRKGGKMSWWGRPSLSPWNSGVGQGGVPSVTEEDFSYITTEDLDSPRYSQRYDYTRSPQAAVQGISRYEEPEDDALNIVYKNVVYPEGFPAYSIGDGKLLVSDVKERVKLILGISDRHGRIRLYYKGRRLRDDDKPIREYGAKHNSEITVTISERESESSSDVGSDEIVIVDRDGHEVREEPEPSKKHRKKRRGRTREERGARSPQSPQESVSDVGLRVPTEDPRKRAASRVRSHSPSAESGFSAASGVSGVSAISAISAGSVTRASPTSVAPGGPIEKLDQIAAHFNNTLLPLCRQFATHPPSDPKKRSEEHLRLSETILQQVLLKFDDIETGGDVAVRTRRKEMVKQCQDILKTLDEALKA
ncbi:hypothetical protein QR685DRAFT_575841 [Neurospora intermedia]|uniref:BAG domain-containing protein n=1 Tax=Neurospora intermedia TaxID=5142 RepID=A0ABR3CZB1_NEUIN